MKLGKANTTNAQNKYKWINLNTHTQSVIYHINGHDTSVKYQMYNRWQFNEPGLGAEPRLLNCHYVPPSLECRPGAVTPPFNTLCDRKQEYAHSWFLSQSAHAQKTIPSIWERHSNRSGAVNVRRDKFGVGLHDRNHIEITWDFIVQT